MADHSTAGVAQPSEAGLSGFAQRLDSSIRHLDFRWNRVSDGPFIARFGVTRHTVVGVSLAALLFFYLAWGPTPGAGTRLWLALLSTLLVVPMAWGMRLTKNAGRSISLDLGIQLCLAAAVIVAVWFGAKRDDAGPEDGWVYRHVFLFGAGVFGVSAALAVPLARWAFKMRAAFDGFSVELPKCELFVLRPKAPAIPGWVLLLAVLRILIRRPLHLIFPPAVAVLLGRGDAWYIARECVWLGAGVFVLNYAVLALADSNERLSSMIDLGESVFFRGTALIVSAAIILVAVLRIMNVDYVTTLLDSDHTLATILSYGFAAYLLSWWYDYWVGRLATNHLMTLLGGALGVVSIPYAVDPKAVSTRVPSDLRFLELQGAHRFVVTRAVNEKLTYFQTYGMYQLFHELAGRAGSTLDLPIGILVRRAWTYAVAVTLLPIAFFTVSALTFLHGHQDAELTVTGGRVTLTAGSLLFSPASCSAGKPLIVIAASGGGTRAAVYTAALLEGLSRKGLIDRVRLASGVSGGGAALAYFGSRRPQLEVWREQPWNDYVGAMASPFISDVLAGLSEWRMMRGTRLGVLLDESFRRRWVAADDRDHRPRLTLSEVTEMGLLWNTSVAGRRPRGNTEDQAATGRLVLTNLSTANAFDPPTNTGSPAESGHYEVVDSPDVRLTTAAALNANFPPVFSNAAVDVDGGDRYWVTDGGALDNSGLETALYVIRQAVRAKGNGPWADCPNPPAIHVITADAGAFSTEYHQDRGVSTALGAGSVFAGRLASELEKDIHESYGAPITVYYLPLPSNLRQSGSFGTHWMLQPNITVKTSDDTVTLHGDEVVKIIRGLFFGSGDGLGPKARTVYDDTRGEFEKRWQPLVTALKGR